MQTINYYIKTKSEQAETRFLDFIGLFGDNCIVYVEYILYNGTLQKKYKGRTIAPIMGVIVVFSRELVQSGTSTSGIGVLSVGIPRCILRLRFDITHNEFLLFQGQIRV